MGIFKWDLLRKTYTAIRIRTFIALSFYIQYSTSMTIRKMKDVRMRDTILFQKSTTFRTEHWLFRIQYFDRKNGSFSF